VIKRKGKAKREINQRRSGSARNTNVPSTISSSIIVSKAIKILHKSSSMPFLPKRKMMERLFVPFWMLNV